MEEAKAAAYYDELTRRGEGAARFKQGLGFSSANSDSENASERGSALPYSTSSSFLSKFVKASSPKKESELQKQAQIESIQNKLKRTKADAAEERENGQRARRIGIRGSGAGAEAGAERGIRGGEVGAERYRERDRDGDRDRDRERRRRGSESDSDGGRRRRWRSRSRSRSSSPRERGSERSKGKAGKEKNGGSADHYKLIEGYDKMSAAERVKAKMKLQLAETAEKDTTKGMGSGWERFEFNKDAPLDDEDVEDDAALVKQIGQNFRFSAVETKREEQLRSAHNEAMFGASDDRPTIVMDSDIEAENDINDSKESEPTTTSLLSDKVLSKKQVVLSQSIAFSTPVDWGGLMKERT
ncbi:hypothetical protein D8674_029666 [Pyrus ussuriensis x Pyrus communis]|uniref:Uncharacterized protein n=1 Tax=Pyrus ussuriensis x Pyrus communis TaxID=2448454 RepID=A0A5N5I0P6_9ROSA|nr:hypothetical protein D8674_029666 [Pyrus ussuriensis x Pyrus communis]